MIRLSFHDLNCSSLFQDSRLDVHPSFIVFGMLTFQLYPKSGPHRVSNNSSHAPSSFSNKSRKRVRLSSPITTPDHSRPPSAAAVNNPNANTSWSSKSSRATSVQIQHSQHSRPSSHRATMSAGPSTSVAHGTVHSSRHQKTRSISQASIPLSAIVSPRAPSVEHLSKFHMRDPRKPRRRPVGWGLRFGTPDDVGSPLHAWCFWLGLLFPLLWWFASFAPIPKTRFVGIGAGQGVNTSADSAEKGITIDDPHVERGAFFFSEFNFPDLLSASLFFFVRLAMNTRGLTFFLLTQNHVHGENVAGSPLSCFSSRTHRLSSFWPSLPRDSTDYKLERQNHANETSQQHEQFYTTLIKFYSALFCLFICIPIAHPSLCNPYGFC